MLRLYLCLFIVVSLGLVGSDHNPIECSEYEFSCYNGQCVNKTLWCNNVQDCHDGSDEKNCNRNVNYLRPKKCPPNFFRCKNNRCIPKSGRCDGFDSCGDSSDEHNCSKEIDATKHSINDISKSSLKASSGVNSTSIFQNDSDQDLYFHPSEYTESEKRAREWLLSIRKDYGWGEDTARAIVALSLTRDGLGENKEEKILMEKQLHLQLSIALAKNQSKIGLSDLALYLNALEASCGDPRNFYGFDLVSKLRHLVNKEHYSMRYATPFVYLTLCLHNATDLHDVKVVRDLFLQRNVLEDKDDMQALVLLTLVCMEEIHNLRDQTLDRFKDRLLEKINRSSYGNVYEVALIYQALREADIDGSFWNMDEKKDFILEHQHENGSFGDILATYYAMPVISGNSIMTLRELCLRPPSDNLTPVEVLENSLDQIHVNYSIYFGHPAEMSRTMYLSLSAGSSIFDMMRLAQEKNRNYRFSLYEKRDVPTVYSIGGVPNDAERGIYWSLYAKEPIDDRGQFNIIPLKENLKNTVLREGDDIIFWLRRI